MGLCQPKISDIEESQEEVSLRHESEENIYELQEFRETEEISKRTELWRTRRQQQFERQQELKGQQEIIKQQELKRQEDIERQKNSDRLSDLNASLTNNLHIREIPTLVGFVEKIKLQRRQELDRQKEVERQSNLRLIRQKPLVEEIKRDPQLIKSLLLCVGQGGWIDKVGGDSVFVLEALENDSHESIQQRNLFRKTNKPCFKVTHVQKMFNPYLFLQFKLKEKQYRKKHHIVKIMNMYHGTKSTNIRGICVNNLDWRKNGTSTGHKFGQGVSFSPYSNYATHYGDKKSHRKVMFAVDILVGESCPGEGNTVIPEGNADTTVNDKGSVYVKYEDNAFYPTYLITYEGFERRY